MEFCTLYRRKPSRCINAQEALVIDVSDGTMNTVELVKKSQAWPAEVKLFQLRKNGSQPLAATHKFEKDSVYYAEGIVSSVFDEKAMGLTVATLGAFIAAIVKNYSDKSSGQLWVGMAGLTCWCLAMLLYGIGVMEFNQNATFASSAIILAVSALNVVLASI